MTAHPTVAHIRELPASLEGSVTADLIDENGHMNVRHYFDLQELAGVALFNRLGVDESYPARTGFGVFTLEQHVTYLSECLPNEKFSVHLRLVALSDKTMHTIGYLVNDSTDTLAHVVENMVAHVDLSTRKVISWPEDIRHALEAATAADPNWTPHTAGCLKTR